MPIPSFKEDYISQIPALQLLMKLGWKYLSPAEAMEAREGRNANVLLEKILKTQLEKINKIEYKGKEFQFSESNIVQAILALRELPEQDGFIAANKYFYELITLGKSLDQTVLGDRKSFSFQYVDWKHPENNIFHITEEFEVARTGRTDTYRPDIVLFINGIPMVVIECKSPKIKDPLDKAIEQHARNQQEDGIRTLYQYSNLTLALTTNDARYGTTATNKEFWSVWKELFKKKEQQSEWENTLSQIKQQSLPDDERTLLFNERFKSVLGYFNQLEKGEQLITAQDKIVYSLCEKERLLELMYNYVIYDDGEKKIARYQQYFAIKKMMNRILHPQPDGKRPGGVIWHTQGSGKSLTMVMLAEQIAQHKEIKNPKIVLVTDRVDLDSQITDTFRKCQMPVENAGTGTSAEIVKKLRGQDLTEEETGKLSKDKSLLKLLADPGNAVITTVINKFESAVKAFVSPFESTDIFVLVDEGHRSQYGDLNINMQKVFPRACFIAFTGTPLLKKEKSTAQKFGGVIDVYSITDAVADGAVVPLLYEGRHNLIEVNEKPLDTYFDKVSEDLTKYGKATLKRKYSSKNILNKADQIIYARAWDISDHFAGNFQNTAFKGQLVTPTKATAIKYKGYLDEIGKVSSEVLISAPDMREGEEDAFETSDDSVKKFWNSRMDKYGTPKKYQEAVIGAFKKQDTPEIIIVVDKLLTGFDAPRNIVLYITRPLKEHKLLQAIARVNRVFPGKDYGFIIDYYGNLENLDKAIKVYSNSNYDAEDLKDAWTNIDDEIKKLPQAHSELWGIFKTIKNKYDEPAYEELLSDEALRHQFYEKVSAYSRMLQIALSSLHFHEYTSEARIAKYKSDVKFFLALRVSVKRRYSDEPDYKEYEPQIQKLIDQHITTDGTILKITDPVNIFNQEQRETELEKITGKAAKADHITSRTIRAINVKMEEDPVFYKRLSQLIKKTIEEYRAQRISEAEYLKKAKEFETTFLTGHEDNIPESVKNNPAGIAVYNIVNDIFEKELKEKPAEAEELTLGIDTAIREHIYENEKLIVDWQNNSDIAGKIKIAIDDFIFDWKVKYDLDISFDDIDTVVEESLKVARLKYVS